MNVLASSLDAFQIDTRTRCLHLTVPVWDSCSGKRPFVLDCPLSVGCDQSVALSLTADDRDAKEWSPVKR